MPYYQAGDYYQGDYYQAGGIFGSIGKVLKKVAGTALKLTPVGRVISTGVEVAKLLKPPTVRPSPFAPIGSPFEGAVDTFGGGPFTGPMAGGGMNGGRKGHFKKDGTWTDRARPRMQVTNTRALKRAGRRVRGFLRIARQLGALPVARGKGKRLFRAKRK